MLKIDKLHKATNLSLPFLLFFFLPFFGYAQSKKVARTGIEVGFDILPYTSQIKKDGLPFQKDFEFFFKSVMEKGELRLKIGRYGQPIHDRDFFKYSIVSEDCTDPTAFRNVQDPEGFFFLYFGYGAKKQFKRFDFFYGSDVNLNRFKGQTIVYREQCLIVVNGERIIDESLYKVINNSNYYGVGLTPFVAIKVPVINRLRLTFETGIQVNYLMGDYSYIRENQSEGAFPIRKFKTNWGKLTSDVGVSYLF